MLSQLKSEFRKLLSVRATYILLIIAVAIIGLFAYLGTSGQTYDKATCTSSGEVLYAGEYIDDRLQGSTPEEVCGGHVTFGTETSSDLNKEKLLFGMQEAVPLMATFVSIILILFVAHEFRYNTINYTLTISNSRSKVLLAKLIIASIFTLLTTLLAIGVSVAVLLVAINVKDLNLPAQDYNWLYVLARHTAYALGYTLFGVAVALLVRNLTSAIAASLVLPTLDGLAGFLLSIRDMEPTKFLPFSALDRFGNVAIDLTTETVRLGEGVAKAASQPATAFVALAVFGVYFVLLWAITWLLFLRRDAN